MEVQNSLDFQDEEKSSGYLEEIKSKFCIFYMTDRDSSDYFEKRNDTETIRKHVDVVIDFYVRFIERIMKMMKNNLDCSLLSIIGP